MRGRFYLPIKRVLGILIFKNFINQGENIPFGFIQNETHNHCRDIIIIELCFFFLWVMNAFCTRAAVVGDGCWWPFFLFMPLYGDGGYLPFSSKVIVRCIGQGGITIEQVVKLQLVCCLWTRLDGVEDKKEQSELSLTQHIHTRHLAAALSAYKKAQSIVMIVIKWI